MSSGLKTLDAMTDVPAAAWDALLFENDKPFLSWGYLDALEQSGAVSPFTGWQPIHFTHWEDGQLVAAAPAYLKSSSGGEYLFDGAWARAADRLGINYFPKLVLTVPFSTTPARRLLVLMFDSRLDARVRDFLAHERAALEQGLPLWERGTGFKARAPA